MKYAVKRAFVLSTFLGASIGHAEILQTLYVGGGYNNTEFADYEFYENGDWEVALDELQDTVPVGAVTFGEGDADDNKGNGGASVFAGWRVLPWLGVEGGVVYHGEAESTASTGFSYTDTSGTSLASLSAEATTETSSVFGSANLYWNLPKNVTLLGRIGAHAWKRDYSEDASYMLDAPGTDNDINVSRAISFDDDGVDLLYGVGVQWDIDNHFSLRLDATRFDIGSDSFADWAIDNYAINLFYRIGAGSSNEKNAPLQDKITACDKKHKHLFEMCNDKGSK